jgi:diaminohydroxyphosphoribosylaminopyrimidine deaminase/5-amino-6-(5-phosphoribosylamino)uracil reductase
LHALLRRLNELEINELLVECGPRLAGAFVREGLVDEWVVYIAPTLLGVDAAPLVALGGADQVPAWEFQSMERVGVDLRVVLRPEKR